jgi:hypothetical protein
MPMQFLYRLSVNEDGCRLSRCAVLIVWQQFLDTACCNQPPTADFWSVEAAERRIKK